MAYPEVARALRMSRDDRLELAQVLYDTKRRVYIDRLNELAQAHGVADYTVAISREIDRLLRAEAHAHAASITDTFNAALTRFLTDLPADLGTADVLDAAERWMDDRNAWHAPLVGVTETYTARSDATLSFYRDAGVTPAFDFLTGGDHGKGAECAVCRALIATNPHSLETAAAVGMPHPNCVHTWVARPVVLPDSLALGRTPGGVLNRSTLVQELGGHRAAAEAIHSGDVAISA